MRGLLKKEKFEVSHKIQNIPSEIIHYMESKTGHKFDFSEGDSTLWRWTHFSHKNNNTNSLRELIFVANFENNYLLHYKHKGLGYHCDGIFFSVTNGKLDKVCFINTIMGFWNFNEYKNLALENNLRFCNHSKKGIFRTDLFCEGLE